MVSGWILLVVDVGIFRNFENIINSISAEDIQEITAQVIDGAHSFEVVFKPKK
jgi:aspartokinase-like uncharacterized kinase